MKIIPAINCHTAEDAEVHAKEASKFTDWVHIDVSDGIFTFNKSWGDASAWAKMKGGLKTEVHLMVEKPEEYVGSWLKAGAERIIIHLETIDGKSLSKIKDIIGTDVKIMLAANPETPAENFKPYFRIFSSFQILAVYPGPSGQKFQTLVLDKVKFLRREMPDATIEVDGGINEETAKLARDAGAQRAVSGSYIFDSPDPEAAYNRLNSI
ncbi:MAG: ribulose-phosphate 3-epimerase [Candidatus Liptonbacteria bacterium]|nr:ribulose-phosphate 3-epimerase [Candidatus Liptonbacteria bacterium]